MTDNNLDKIDAVALALINAYLAGSGLKPFERFSDLGPATVAEYRKRACEALNLPLPVPERERRIRKRAAEALRKHGYGLAADNVLTHGGGNTVSGPSIRLLAYDLAAQAEPEPRSDDEKLKIARECYAQVLEGHGCPRLAQFARSGTYDKDTSVVSALKALEAVGA